MSDETWHRVRITCTVECTTAVHIGDGETASIRNEQEWLRFVPPRPDGWPVRREKKTDFEYNRFVRDEEGNPTIPPATLRGALRAACKDGKVREILFGSDPEAGDTRAGLLRCLHATWPAENPATTLSRHVAIDPVTGTAMAQKLFTFEVVPPETKFRLEFELRDEQGGITPSRVQQFVQLLRNWSGGPDSALGGRKSRAFGRIRLLDESIKAAGLSTGQLRKWFAEPHDNPVQALNQDHRFQTIEGLDTSSPQENGCIFELTLRNTSPFLVHDPLLVRDKPGKGEDPLQWLLGQPHEGGDSLPRWFVKAVEACNFLDDNEDFITKWKKGREKETINGFQEKDLIEYVFKNLFLPDLEYARQNDGRPVIPAASLAGCLRSQARRILKTLAWQQLSGNGADPSHLLADTVAEELTSTLFGHENRQSLLWFEDGRLEGHAGETTSYEHHQTFIAIDRFTGGVAESKLYQANAVAPQGRFRIPIHLRRRPLDDWALGLLALVLRDLHHGKFTIGWGGHKGYGRFEVGEEKIPLEETLEGMTSWQAGEKKGIQEALTRWVRKLNETVKNRVETQLESLGKGKGAGGPDKGSETGTEVKR